MAHDLVWDRRMLGVFRASACLTEEEDMVLTDWANGKSVANTAIMHSMSERTVNRIKKKIRLKYDRVQIYTPELPLRNTR